MASMNLQLQHLVSLQEIDLDIQGLQDQLKTIPKQIETSLSHLNQEKQELELAQQEIKDLQKKRSRLEQDAASENDKMAKTKVKLPSVKTNKEYSALLAEIELGKNKISEIEDLELETMEILETREDKIPNFMSNFRLEEKKFHDFKKQKEQNATTIEENINELKDKRKNILKDIAPKWSNHYEKIINARGGLAVVSINNAVCLGCNQQILLQVSIEIKLGEKIHQCQHCSRFLYFIPENETEPAVSE